MEKTERCESCSNRLFEIAVEDNEWSAAWCLLEREDIDDGS